MFRNENRSESKEKEEGTKIDTDCGQLTLK